MKKKLLKSFAFVALGLFATSAYAQSESEIQDAVVAVIGDNWTMEGMVQQDGSSYILGDQSTHHRGSITSPEFPVTGDLLFIPNGEAWTGATWKNNLIISVTFKYTDASGDEQTEVVTQELLIDKNGRPYNLNFQRPEGVPENATMYVNLKVEGTGHNIVSPGTFELTAHELVIDENSEVNTDRLALNVGRNIRLRVIRSFSNTKFYTLSLPFQFSQQWADRLSLQRFCGYCHIWENA